MIVFSQPSGLSWFVFFLFSAHWHSNVRSCTSTPARIENPGKVEDEKTKLYILQMNKIIKQCTSKFQCHYRPKYSHYLAVFYVGIVKTVGKQYSSQLGYSWKHIYLGTFLFFFGLWDKSVCFFLSNYYSAF